MGETKAATQFGWSVPTDYWMIRANGLFSLSHLELLGIGVYRSYVLIYNVLSNLSLSHPDLMIWITILVQLCFSIRLYLWGLLNLSWAFMSYRRSPEFGEHSGNYSETVTKPLDFSGPSHGAQLKSHGGFVASSPGNQHHADAASALLTGAHCRHEPICVPQRTVAPAVKWPSSGEREGQFQGYQKNRT